MIFGHPQICNLSNFLYISLIAKSKLSDYFLREPLLSFLRTLTLINLESQTTSSKLRRKSVMILSFTNFGVICSNYNYLKQWLSNSNSSKHSLYVYISSILFNISPNLVYSIFILTDYASAGVCLTNLYECSRVGSNVLTYFFAFSISCLSINFTVICGVLISLLALMISLRRGTP